jgi:hypothetical protein
MAIVAPASARADCIGSALKAKAKAVAIARLNFLMLLPFQPRMG